MPQILTSTRVYVYGLAPRASAYPHKVRLAFLN